MTLLQSDITNGLKDLGLKPGCKVLVHSSLSSLCYVEGGADTVIAALLEAIGTAGTLIVPTLTGSEALSSQNPPTFDPMHTPCWTGRIPETLRKRRNALRSLHPTHSVAALGADAAALTRDHIDSITPCDDLSPYGKLATLEDGYILLLGVTHEANTTFHHVEEIIGVDYHMQPGFAAAQIMVDGQPFTHYVMLHAYGTPRRFDVMDAVFTERGIQQVGRIGEAAVRLVHARRMVEATAQALRVDKRILCAP